MASAGLSCESCQRIVPTPCADAAEMRRCPPCPREQPARYIQSMHSLRGRAVAAAGKIHSAAAVAAVVGLKPSAQRCEPVPRRLGLCRLAGCAGCDGLGARDVFPATGHCRSTTTRAAQASSPPTFPVESILKCRRRRHSAFCRCKRRTARWPPTVRAPKEIGPRTWSCQATSAAATTPCNCGTETAPASTKWRWSTTVCWQVHTFTAAPLNSTQFDWPPTHIPVQRSKSPGLILSRGRSGCPL